MSELPVEVSRGRIHVAPGLEIEVVKYECWRKI